MIYQILHFVRKNRLCTVVNSILLLLFYAILIFSTNFCIERDGAINIKEKKKVQIFKKKI